MKREMAWGALIVILLTAAFLRQYRLLDFPLYGDEVDEGDIALEMLHGNFVLFYPHNEGNEPLFQLTMVPFFAILGDSTIANRFPSMAWSIVFVALTYTFSRVLFCSRRVGVMAAGLAAVLWFPIVFGRLGLREISQPVMMMPALMGLVIAFRDPSDKRAWHAAIVGGIFAGLTAYTFLSGRGFPVLLALFLCYLLIAHRSQFTRRAKQLALYCAITLAIIFPLFIYLQVNPGLDYHVQDLTARSLLARGSLEDLFQHTVDTLGMFTFSGDMNWVRNIPGRPVFRGLEGWLFYLGVAVCMWRWRKPEFFLPLIVVGVFLLPNVLTEDPPRWTRSIGILPGLVVIPVLPIDWLWKRVTQWFADRVWVNASYAALVALLGVSILTRTATDMFGAWLDNPGVYWMTLAFYDGAGNYVRRALDTTPFNYVMDVYTDWREHNVQRSAQRNDIAMRYSVLTAFVFPNDVRGNRIAFQTFGSPGNALTETFLDLDRPIFVDARVDPQGERPLRVYFVPRARLEGHLVQARNNPVISPATNLPLSLPLRAGDNLEFAGYEVLNPNARPGFDLQILTYWRVLQRPPNLAVFVHLVDAQQRIVAQFDGLEALVHKLEPDDIIVQLHTLRLPNDLPASEYRLELGMYNRSNLQRVPLSSGTDYVLLMNIFDLQN